MSFFIGFFYKSVQIKILNRETIILIDNFQSFVNELDFY